MKKIADQFTPITPKKKPAKPSTKYEILCSRTDGSGTARFGPFHVEEAATVYKACHQTNKIMQMTAGKPIYKTIILQEYAPSVSPPVMR